MLQASCGVLQLPGLHETGWLDAYLLCACPLRQPGELGPGHGGLPSLHHNLRDENVTVVCDCMRVISTQVIVYCFWKLILKLTFFSCPSCTVAYCCTVTY